MLMLVFGVILHVLPVSGRGATLWGWSFLTIDGLRHLIIPAVALSSVQMAMNARLTRASMLEVMRQEYIDTARAKGLTERVVLIKHAFRNALAPVVTNVGLQVGALFAGAVLTETTTAWPGIGRLMYESIIRRDQAVVFGLALFMAPVIWFRIFSLTSCMPISIRGLLMTDPNRGTSTSRTQNDTRLHPITYASWLGSCHAWLVGKGTCFLVLACYSRWNPLPRDHAGPAGLVCLFGEQESIRVLVIDLTLISPSVWAMGLCPVGLAPFDPSKKRKELRPGLLADRVETFLQGS